VLAGKRLELLKETVAKLSRVAVLWNPRKSGNAQQKPTPGVSTGLAASFYEGQQR
jgi:hypothetical protein